MDLLREFAEIIAALDATEIDYAVCGAMKLAAGRPQDIADIRSLEEANRG